MRTNRGRRHGSRPSALKRCVCTRVGSALAKAEKSVVQGKPKAKMELQAMWTRGAFFIAGIFAASVVKPLLRPVVREAIRGGLSIGSVLTRISEDVREEFEDVRAEERARSQPRAAAGDSDLPPQASSAGKRTPGAQKTVG
jgi:hypothetical protein